MFYCEVNTDKNFSEILDYCDVLSKAYNNKIKITKFDDEEKIITFSSDDEEHLKHFLDTEYKNDEVEIKEK